MSEGMELITSVFTVLGVIFIGWQVYLTKKQAQTQLEDEMVQEYRAIIREIPSSVLLGIEAEENQAPKIRELIYNYIDLSNQQVFLRQQGRISKNTWIFWCDGMKANLKLREFENVWKEIKQSEHSFSELRKLEEGFSSDPKKW